MKTTGIAKTIDEFLFSPDLSGLFRINLIVLEVVRQNIYKSADFKIMKAIDSDVGMRVAKRAIALPGAMRQFVGKYGIGLVKIATEIEQCQSRI